MDNSPTIFECEHGCGFEAEDAKVVEAHESTCGPDVLSDRILVKWHNLSYLHCTWETEKAIRRMANVYVVFERGVRVILLSQCISIISLFHVSITSLKIEEHHSKINA